MLCRKRSTPCEKNGSKTREAFASALIGSSRRFAVCLSYRRHEADDMARRVTITDAGAGQLESDIDGRKRGVRGPLRAEEFGARGYDPERDRRRCIRPRSFGLGD